jgi:hypothetical protein
LQKHHVKCELLPLSSIGSLTDRGNYCVLGRYGQLDKRQSIFRQNQQGPAGLGSYINEFVGDYGHQGLLGCHSAKCGVPEDCRGGEQEQLL